MSLKIKFGTDGWRARIADEYTFENCRRCAQGFANYLLKHGKKGARVVVGYDKRFHSENFAHTPCSDRTVLGGQVCAGDQPASSAFSVGCPAGAGDQFFGLSAPIFYAD